ncbi:MAG: 50S ribosomal protein L25 [Candidatus Marinimicrobia bacterium]|nr:50S ribosomal protein L25 [Candidatus Neomarinimicrobiota bacterium]MCH7762277.1 50S ribosomal protein L25 [Candidatus Neomarinimicrobiota bacterium]
MTEYYQLTVENRETIGAKEAKSLRRNGKIPANYYYKEMSNINLSIDEKELNQAIHSGHRIFEVNLTGETQYVMFKAIQYHPVTDNVIHVDLMRVRRDEKMIISVPIRLEGDAEGVKQGGVLSQVLNTVDIECLPMDVPEFISLDISELEVNSSVSVANLAVDSKLTILAAEDQVIATCHPPREEEEVEVEVEEGEEVEVEEGEEKAESDAGAEESAE